MGTWRPPPDRPPTSSTPTPARGAAEAAEAAEAARHDIALIGRLQQALLPERLPAVPTLDLAAHYRATNQAGGDYYDAFELARGRWGFFVADASGHGPAAAVLMAIARTLARTHADSAGPPGRLLGAMNGHLAELATRSSGTFVTACYAIYDPAAGTLGYANAGHPAPRLVRGRGGPPAPLDGRCRLPLGISADEEYPQEVVRVRPGDRVVMYTDGVTEAKNPAGEAFGVERLDAALAAGAATAQGLIDGVVSRLDDFAAGRPADDDRTLVALKFVAGAARGRPAGPRHSPPG